MPISGPQSAGIPGGSRAAGPDFRAAGRAGCPGAGGSLGTLSAWVKRADLDAYPSSSSWVANEWRRV
jgi:hypothetical protein